MLDPNLTDHLITHYTANMLRDILLHGELTVEGRAYVIAALYYMEGTDND